MSQENIRISPLSTALKFGLLTTLISSIYFVLLFLIEKQFSLGLIFLSLIFPIIVIFFATSTYKKLNGKTLTFKQGFLFGLLFFFIYWIGAFIFNELYINFIVPDYIDGMMEKTESFMERFNLPEEEIEKAIDKAKDKQGKFINRLKGSLINTAIIAIIMSLISAAIFKTSKTEQLV